MDISYDRQHEFSRACLDLSNLGLTPAAKLIVEFRGNSIAVKNLHAIDFRTKSKCKSKVVLSNSLFLIQYMMLTVLVHFYSSPFWYQPIKVHTD